MILGDKPLIPEVVMSHNTRHKVWSLNPRAHEEQMEEQKSIKSSRRSSRRRKTAKANKSHEKWQNHKKSKKNSKPKQKPKVNTPPNTLNASSSHYIDIIIFLLSTTLLAKSSTNFVHNLSLFGNELIKHKLREERDAMHKIQN
jgi:hypothetical protein